MLATCLSAAVPMRARAADSADPGLLEFLGSVDSPDQNWRAYLARDPSASQPPSEPPSSSPPSTPPAAPPASHSAGPTAPPSAPPQADHS